MSRARVSAAVLVLCAALALSWAPRPAVSSLPAAGGAWGSKVSAEVTKCNCTSDMIDPVCDTKTLEWVADSACTANCEMGLTDFVKCSAVRTVSWKNGCNCRNVWDPVCAGNGDIVSANTACGDCLEIQYEDTCSIAQMAQSLMKKEPAAKKCNCAGAVEPVCSTISFQPIAASPCEARCKGYISFMPCKDLPNAAALIPATRTDEPPVAMKTCTAPGLKLGDVAGMVGCRYIIDQCRAWKQPMTAASSWMEEYSFIPMCSSGGTRDCYEGGTDWAIEQEGLCLDLLSLPAGTKINGLLCDGAEARDLFGKAVSNVCAEEARDGEAKGWTS